MTGRLIDRFLPEADERTVHAIAIRATPERVLATAEAFDLESLWLVRALFRVRSWLLGYWRKVSPGVVLIRRVLLPAIRRTAEGRN